MIIEILSLINFVNLNQDYHWMCIQHTQLVELLPCSTSTWHMQPLELFSFVAERVPVLAIVHGLSIALPPRSMHRHSASVHFQSSISFKLFWDLTVAPDPSFEFICLFCSISALWILAHVLSLLFSFSPLIFNYTSLSIQDTTSCLGKYRTTFYSDSQEQIFYEFSPSGWL